MMRPKKVLEPNNDTECVNFRETPFSQMAMRAQGFLGTYMIALAALQRGLKVSFLFSTEDVKTNIAGRTQVQVGRVYKISDGKREYIFQSSAGEFSSKFSRQVTIRKDTQKALYIAAGIKTPFGAESNKERVTQDLDTIFQATKSEKFVIKPIDGSLARDTFVDKTGEEIINIAKDYPHDKFMLEEFIRGPEYRFTVVNEKVVGVFERKPPYVIGDGESNIQQLVNLKNDRRRRNPFLATKPIKLDTLLSSEDEANATLRVPARGEYVVLSALQRVGEGGEPWDVTDEMPNYFKEMAVAACRCVKAKNAGVDIIIGDLADLNSARLLESNIRHHIEGHSFCENKTIWDNNVAESIIDLYFPHSTQWKRHPTAIFDISEARLALGTQAFAEVALPAFGPHWDTYTAIIRRTKTHDIIKRAAVTESAKLGVYTCEAIIDQKTASVTFMAPQVVLKELLSRTGLQRTLKIADEIEQMERAQKNSDEPGREPIQEP